MTIDRDCRSVLWIDSGRGDCRVVADLEQRLDQGLETALSSDTRLWNRGLKTIRQIPGGFVVCDIFGIYQLDEHFKIEKYLSIPQFIDIHSALPYGEHLLVSNTGADQVLLVDWSGKILESIDLHRWFPATPWMAHDLAMVRERWGGDLRRMPLDWARESCHVNWAELTSFGLVISCFIQGEILVFRDSRPALRIPAGAKLHTPRYLKATNTFLFSSSEENRIVEVDMEGKEVWSMEGFRFAKYAGLLPNGNMIVADTGNRRIAEVNREAKKIVWEIPVKGTPYDVQLWDRTITKGTAKSTPDRPISKSARKGPKP